MHWRSWQYNVAGDHEGSFKGGEREEKLTLAELLLYVQSSAPPPHPALFSLLFFTISGEVRGNYPFYR